jgi:hypothetical protein
LSVIQYNAPNGIDPALTSSHAVNEKDGPGNHQSAQ